MRFFRGIAVSAAESENIISSIRSGGLVGGEGDWQMKHEYPGDLRKLLIKPGLSTMDTRPGKNKVDAVCACGDLAGAMYYAHKHNKNKQDDVAIIIEFEAMISQVAIDGGDFLYTAFQLANPRKARSILSDCFGPAILKYADRAWSSDDQSYRIALCDLAIHDVEVIKAHYSNAQLIAGRCGTLFRSAFTISLPIWPRAVNGVRISMGELHSLPADVLLTGIIEQSLG